MGPPQRVRYNSKARGSTAGGGKTNTAGKRVKSKSNGASQPSEEFAPSESNANAEIILPKNALEKEKERERKAAMKAEIIAASETKMSSKKKKKLDSYIDKKLKKEERLELFKKLAVSQNEVSALGLHSSAALGSGRLQTHSERLAHDEDKHVRRALDGIGPRKRRRLMPSNEDDNESDGSSSHDDGGSGNMELDDPTPSTSHPVVEKKVKKKKGKSSTSMDVDSPARAAPSPLPPSIPVHSPAAIQPQTINPPVAPAVPVTIGSALARNADGSVIAPRIVKRKKKIGRTIFRGRRGEKVIQGSDDEDGNEGEEDSDDFDSSASSDDAADDDDDADDVEDGSDADENNDGADSSNDDEDQSSEGEAPALPQKRSFKAWAQRQILASKADASAPVSDPSLIPIYDDDEPVQLAPNLLEQPAKPREKTEGDVELKGPLGADLQLPETSFAKALSQKQKGSLSHTTIAQQAEGSSSASPSNPAVTASSSKNLIPVTRPVDIQNARLALPVVAEEQHIIETIRLNPVVVICGETGSGKTTQVPQFLFEAGFGSPGTDNPGMIGVTQPRRVAAMSMAARVATELSLPPSRVSYQIRYDATTSPSTSIKFMTDGVLLRELAVDFLLNKYSVIIVDEAHERSMNTDILIGVLSRVLRLREERWKKDEGKPLRLIIMSATLRISDFTSNRTLFPAPPPTISIAARQHPVTVHFNRRTPADYVTEAVKKTSKIHARLPEGGILIFMTGQAEIGVVCKKLDAKFGPAKVAVKGAKGTAVPGSGPSKRVEADDKRAKGKKNKQAKEDARFGDLDSDQEDAGREARPSSQTATEPEEGGLSTQSQMPDVHPELDGPLGDDDDPEALNTDDEDEGDMGIDMEQSDVPMHIVPLYSLLSSEKQMKVFQPPPEGHRLVVVATNVAETSLTIPGIRYVVDCGRAKQREHDTQSGVQNFRVAWVSKASASQRAGRAGRTGPGHCYRLYSSALFEHHFPKFSEPEILRVPIEGVVLQMKAMHIDAVANFPFPTPPDRISLKKAETILTHLGALGFDDSKAKSKVTLSLTTTPRMTIGGHITDLGKAMSLFPVSPRFSKMLVAGQQHGALPYVIAIVAALSVGNPFKHEDFLDKEDDKGKEDTEAELSVPELNYIRSEEIRSKEERKVQRRKFFQNQQLHTQLGGGTSDVFRTLSVIGAYEYAGGGLQFCDEHFVRPKAMEEIHKLRAQISSIVQSNFPNVDAGFSPKLPPPSTKQIKILRQLLTAGFIDQVAVRKDLIAKDSDGTKYASARGVPYRALNVDEDVFIHPSSLFFHGSPPEYIVFQEVVRTTRVWIKTNTVINPTWLPSLGPSMCTFSKPKEVPSSMKGVSVVTPRYGDAFDLPVMKL